MSLLVPVRYVEDGVDFAGGWSDLPVHAQYIMRATALHQKETLKFLRSRLVLNSIMFVTYGTAVFVKTREERCIVACVIMIKLKVLTLCARTIASPSKASIDSMLPA